MAECKRFALASNMYVLTQAPVAVPSAASFPDGAAPPAAKTTAMDDLLGLESEISAIQVK